jgi:hypothetical protein
MVTQSFFKLITPDHWLIAFGFLLVVLILGLFFLNRRRFPPPSIKIKNPLTQINISPTPRPTLVPIPSGSQTFRLSSGKKTGPQLNEITVNPYDPRLGSTQSVTLKASSLKPITQVTATLFTDNHHQESTSLSQSSGDSRNGTWVTFFQYDNSYDYIYKMTFTATDSSGETTTFDLILR